MEISWRRLLVTLEIGPEIDESTLPKRRKCAISVPHTSTNADLREEVAKTFNVDRISVSLEVNGGFELREQDSIMTLREDEVITAKLVASDETGNGPSSSLKRKVPTPPKPTVVATRTPDKTMHKGNGRRILFVTPEMARRFANAHPNSVDEPSTEDFGIFAFRGTLVDDRVTLGALKREAAQLLGLAVDPESMDNDGCTECQPNADETCACTIANEIQAHGLLSSMHCRLSIDGSVCSNGIDCPYSHSRTLGPNKKESPRCTLCDEHLGSPCSLCQDIIEINGMEPSKYVHCPIVANAGCEHLHHAHCLEFHLPEGTSSRSIQSKSSCPSGCPRLKYPFEPRIFGRDGPHVVIVWDGSSESKITYLPIPQDLCPDSARCESFEIETSAIVGLVREHFIAQQIAVPRCGLTIQVHNRDPTREQVRLTQTALVSVCAASSHNGHTAGRFELFAPDPGYQNETSSTSGACSKIDFHTSSFPVFSSCDCVTLGDLLLLSSSASPSPSTPPLVLYVVQRKVAGDVSAPKKDGKTTFLDSPAWHPAGTKQTPRGIACLLSSLYLMAEVVARQDNDKQHGGMRNVLAMLYMITRFPPAVRALALIIKNITLVPEEQACLAEAIYYALKAFSYQAPVAIANNDERMFETARILLGWVMTSSKVPSTPTLAIEDISLICAASGNKLRDPVQCNVGVSERGFAMLHLPRAELYRPRSDSDQKESQLIELEPESLLPQLIRMGRQHPHRNSLVVLYPYRIGAAPSACTMRLEVAGRDFIASIQQANQTDLVTRGPLDLKAPAIIAPQLVLDSEGFIAVFTGRGCGSVRDINFFRPTASGDTAVDINDVANALDQVIPSRKMEKTWEIDTFSAAGAPSRDPAEAIFLCLDLSQSMNSKSGVEGTHRRIETSQEVKVQERINELTSNLTDNEILDQACTFVYKQHWTSLVALKSKLAFLKKQNGYRDDPGNSAALNNLIAQLMAVARRDIVQVANNDELGSETPETIASFLKLCIQGSPELSEYLDVTITLASADNNEVVGIEPFSVPRRFIDPRTGNLLKDPCSPQCAPNGIYVDRDSLSWFDGLDNWPAGIFMEHVQPKWKVKTEITTWTSGKELLSKINHGRASFEVTFVHHGKVHLWRLTPTTTTRTLYMLANRAVEAAYSSFSLKISGSWALIRDSETLLLASITGIREGCRIELGYTVPHSRNAFVFSFKGLNNCVLDGPNNCILLPYDATVCSLFAFTSHSLSDTTLWHGLRKTGDGHRTGTPISASFTEKLLDHLSLGDHELEAFPLHVKSDKAKESQYLTRLHLMNELFNVFLNRACSFDTTVPLVLGLVTFSDTAQVAQPLTHLFEKFREQLGRVTATGDTAVYDALDVARLQLVQYRTDLPHLRRRIIIVSDGKDTSSKQSVLEVLAGLQRDSIIVDSVQVGPTVDPALHGISVVTGGYRFCPRTSLSDALSIFDLETVLNSAERPIQIQKRIFVATKRALIGTYGDTSIYPIDVVTLDKFPKRAEHPALFEKVKPLQLINVTGRGKDDRMKRIMREAQNLLKKPAPYMDLYFDESNMTFLRIVMEAPKDKDCLYRNGVYLLTCDFLEGYPREPPQIRFTNFIMHPNVSKQGKVCIAELGRLWSSDMSMEMALQLVYQIFSHPDLENPVETQASMRYYDDDGRYAFAVAEAVKTHASKTRAEWRAELEDKPQSDSDHCRVL